MGRPMRVCAIDIGTNSVRMLVAEVDDSGGPSASLRAIARSGEPCRLGHGLGRTGAIEATMAGRAGELSKQFYDRARGLGVERVLVAATAAIRGASNGSEVASEIQSRIGLPVRILSGEDEARLTYGSVVAGLGVGATRSACVVFDLGGGSTEVVSGVGPQVGRWASMPVGAVSLTERYLSSDPPSQAEIQALKTAVRDELMHDCAYMPESAPILAGVGGTVTVLALLDRGDNDYDPGRIEGWLVTPERLRTLVHQVVASPLSLRRSWRAMGEGRADIAAAGALMVEALFDRFPSRGLLCSTQGLRYGLARLAAVEGQVVGGPAEGR
jgi:exopolyphosphatase/guanosine-5'-triphosphate,3'-diphosphate pyrophosphatase